MKKNFRTIASSFIIIVAILTMSITASAESSSDLTQVNTWQEIISYLSDGVNVDLNPGEVRSVPIPLSDGSVAFLELGCYAFPQSRGTSATTYTYKSNGNYTVYAKIDGGLAGTYSHKVNFNVFKTSPVCQFKITSSNVESQTPGVGMTVGNSSVTDIVNHTVGTSAYTHAYTSFIAGSTSIPVNVYDKVLMNSDHAEKIRFTIYFDFAPIS